MFSWVAAAAACLEPTAYCRDTSDTCVIAATTWSEADRCCWVAILISLRRGGGLIHHPGNLLQRPHHIPRQLSPRMHLPEPSSEAKIVAFVSA